MKIDKNNFSEKKQGYKLIKKHKESKGCLFLEVETGYYTPYLITHRLIEGLYVTDKKSLIKENCKALNYKIKKGEGITLSKIDDFCLLTITDEKGTTQVLVSRDLDRIELEDYIEEMPTSEGYEFRELVLTAYGRINNTFRVSV